MKNILRTIALWVLLLGAPQLAHSQSSVPVVPTGETQMLHGTKYYIHIVQKGQTVFSISRAYGLHYSAAVLKTDIHSLSVGDTVWLPFNDQSQASVLRAIGTKEAVEPTQEITIVQGQTLYSVCRTYGVTMEQLYQHNPGLKEEGLKAGQKLHLPLDAKPKTSAPAQPKTTQPAQPKTTQPAQPKPTPQPKPAAPTTGGQYHYQEPAQPKPATTTAKPATTATAPVALPAIRERISKDKVCVSLMIPLRLDKMSEISTTKFDVDQRGKKEYRSFEFVQFAEGVMMALEDLEKEGVSVSLNVVDVNSDKTEEITALYNSHNVAQSDIIIALLPHTSFDIVAGLAKKDHVFIVSPFATRSDILQDNPYAIKYMPSNAGMVKTMLDAIQLQYPGSPIYIVHSNAKAEQDLKNELERQLKNRGITNYGIVDWNQNSKLVTALKAANHPVVISVYDQGKDKNRLYCNMLLNRLSSLKSDPPVLFSFSNFVKDIPDVDFGQLQALRYHLFYSAYLDYNTQRHQDFIDRFKDKYKTQPTAGYAPVGYDLMMFFASGIHTRGTAFWSNINSGKSQSLLFPVQYQQAPSGGFENQAPVMYELIDFHLQPVYTR